MKEEKNELIKFRTFIQYHRRDNNGDVIQEEKTLFIECASGKEAAQAALADLDSINGITTMQLFVSVNTRANDGDCGLNDVTFNGGFNCG